MAYAQKLELRIIDLKHRPAHELVDTLRAFVGENESIQANNFHLIVKASEDTFTQLQTMVEKLDHAPVSLTIYFREGNNLKKHDSFQVNSAESSSLLVKNHQQKYYSSMQKTHVIRAVSGIPVFVSSQRSLPDLLGWQKPSRQPMRRYQTTQSGFYAIIYVLTDDKVRISVTRHKESFDNQHQLSGVSGSHIETTVVGYINQWITIGSTQKLINLNQQKVYSTHQSDKLGIGLQVKVERNP